MEKENSSHTALVHLDAAVEIFLTDRERQSAFTLRNTAQKEIQKLISSGVQINECHSEETLETFYVKKQTAEMLIADLNATLPLSLDEMDKYDLFGFGFHSEEYILAELCNTVRNFYQSFSYISRPMQILICYYLADQNSPLLGRYFSLKILKVLNDMSDLPSYFKTKDLKLFMLSQLYSLLRINIAEHPVVRLSSAK